MLITLPDLLSADTLAEVKNIAAQAQYQDGKLSAGRVARGVKQNLQAVNDAPEVVRAQELVSNALLQNEAFRLYAMPKRIMPPRFNRYDTGMSYGNHVDNALMPTAAGVMRGDISVTVFLSSPDDYEGGELLINSDGGSNRIKPMAGSAVLYPSDTLHRVEKVTKGTRYAAITWVQSLVRDVKQRQMLAELAGLVQWAHGAAPDSGEAVALGKVRANLVRMWVEP